MSRKRIWAFSALEIIFLCILQENYFVKELTPLKGVLKRVPQIFWAGLQRFLFTTNASVIFEVREQINHMRQLSCCHQLSLKIFFQSQLKVGNHTT